MKIDSEKSITYRKYIYFSLIKVSFYWKNKRQEPRNIADTATFRGLKMGFVSYE